MQIQCLYIGECILKLTPSYFDGDILYTGKIVINTGTIDEHCKEADRAQKVYRKLRNWMKKHYWSRLAYLNKLKKIS